MYLFVLASLTILHRNCTDWQCHWGILANQVSSVESYI
jgi:hypothetical protein